MLQFKYKMPQTILFQILFLYLMCAFTIWNFGFRNGEAIGLLVGREIELKLEEE